MEIIPEGSVRLLEGSVPYTSVNLRVRGASGL